MGCQYKYIRCVFTVGSYLTNYYYNNIVVVKNTLILEIKTIIRVKNIISDTKNGQNNKVLKCMAQDMRKIQGRRFPTLFIGGRVWTSKCRIYIYSTGITIRKGIRTSRSECASAVSYTLARTMTFVFSAEPCKCNKLFLAAS